MSGDDGSTWTEISTLDLQDDVPGAPGDRQAAFRTTAFDVLEDGLLWIGDDLMAPYFAVTSEAFRRREAGAHVFTASKRPGPLHPRASAYLGHPGRSLTDLGPCYLATTEAKLRYGTQSPQVFLIAKANPAITCEVMKLPHFGSDGTGLSYSMASRRAQNGTFFSCRDAGDVVDCGGPRLLRWQVAMA
jgi:hypothetical protein